jgi:hypothetical protein
MIKLSALGMWRKRWGQCVGFVIRFLNTKARP